MQGQGHAAVLVCIRPTYSEYGDKTAVGLTDPLAEFRDAIRGLLLAADGREVVEQEREMLYVFDSPAQALRCTQSVQRAIAESGHRRWLGAKIGCFGAARTGDGFSNWESCVQQARHLAHCARPGQTFACANALVGLDDDFASELMPLDPNDWANDRTGFGLPLYRIEWQSDLETRLSNPAQHNGHTSSRVEALRLRWRGGSLLLDQGCSALTMGRSNQADITIESHFASRIHATVEFLNAGFMLTDQSTNGTYLTIDDAPEIYLHDDRVFLRGHGCISLGRRQLSARGQVVYFKAEHPDTHDQAVGR